jgi:hypothetical protein
MNWNRNIAIFYSSLITIMILVSDTTRVPFYVIFRNRLYWVCRWVLFLVLTPKLLNKYASKYWPKTLSATLIFLAVFFRIRKFNLEMNTACYRLRTDTFDNYYDGNTPVNKNLIPQYLPKSFIRDEAEINIPEVSCKLRAHRIYFCWNYFLDEYTHDEIWKRQTPCKKRHNADRAAVFKDLIPDPKTQVLGWNRPDTGPANYDVLNVVKKVVPYFGEELAVPTSPDDIENSPKEFFIDFRGKNSEKGIPIVKAKDFRKYDPEIKERLEGKEESLEHPSIIRIFYDTTSRFRFYRKFKKTIKFLTNLKHHPDSTYEVNEMLKFHTHAGFTDPNQVAYDYGISYDQCT